MEFVVRIVISGLVLIVPGNEGAPHSLVLPDTNMFNDSCDEEVARHHLRFLGHEAPSSEGSYWDFEWEKGNETAAVSSASSSWFPEDAERSSASRIASLSDVLGQSVSVSPACLDPTTAECEPRALIRVHDGELSTLMYVAENRLVSSAGTVRPVRFGDDHRAVAEVVLLEMSTEALDDYLVVKRDGTEVAKIEVQSREHFTSCGDNRYCYDLRVLYSTVCGCRDGDRFRSPGYHIQLLYPLLQDVDCNKTDCDIPRIQLGSPAKRVDMVDPTWPKGLETLKCVDLARLGFVASQNGPRKVFNPPICPPVRP